MTKVNHKSEQLTFWELINKLEIEIPIIQRDYAQGRIEQKKVRTSFLQALFDAVCGVPTELDFVYGSISNSILSPLDGQQRLSTLFLLHWYAAIGAGVLNCAGPILKRFSYKTRASAREFCSKLTCHDTVPSEGNLSAAIIDANWFLQSWEKDPTISAMLTMIDDIHLKFKDAPNLWQQLTESNQRKITFQFIELENFGLSDDLYIKMNARGKQLSAFENFKASFEQHISNGQWDIDKEVTLTFSHKADTIWTDLFWRAVGYKRFDKAYSQFIANSLINSLGLNSSSSRESRAKEIQSIFKNPEEVDPYRFDKVAYDSLCKSLDVYAKIELERLEIKFPVWQQGLSSRETLFQLILDIERATWPIRVLFLAQTEYLLRNTEFVLESYNDWMRVIRNIIQNTTVDSADTFLGASGLVHELSAGSYDIFGFLAVSPITSGFGGAQLKEEIIKAKLIVSNNQYKAPIFKAEDTNFCKGRISFLLYCIDYEEGAGTFDVHKFSRITDLIIEHFSSSDISNEIRRALLTIEDGCFYYYWGSYLYAADAPKRCLIEDTDDLKNFAYNRRMNGRFEFREYLKRLLDQLLQKQLLDLLSEFECPDEFPTWKAKLIKEPRWLELSQKHYIAISHNNKYCYLIPQKKVANTTDGYIKLERVG